MESLTLSQKIQDLQNVGYTIHFSVNDDHLVNLATKEKISIDDFEIEYFFRFEGMTNPSDSSILYAIKTNKGEKGTFVESYGANSSFSKNLAKKLNN